MNNNVVSAGSSATSEERVEEILQEMNLSAEETDALRTVSRLLVGGALEGWDELLTHLVMWEEETRAGQSPEGQIQVIEAGERMPPAVELRHVLLGLMFETQSRMRTRRRRAFKRAGQVTEALLSPALKRMENSRALGPARSRFEELVSRGEKVAERWAQRGRFEETYSRRLVRTAANEGFSYSMDQLGQAPQLQDLVRKQSAGLTQDVIDEVRVRTVTGDQVAEKVVRSLLRRAPRETLPAPATAESDQQS